MIGTSSFFLFKAPLKNATRKKEEVRVRIVNEMLTYSSYCKRPLVNFDILW